MKVILCEKCGKIMDPSKKQICEISIKIPNFHSTEEKIYDVCPSCAMEIQHLFNTSIVTDLLKEPAEKQITKSDKIRNLIALGKTNREIADELNYDIKHVVGVRYKDAQKAKKKAEKPDNKNTSIKKAIINSEPMKMTKDTLETNVFLSKNKDCSVIDSTTKPKIIAKIPASGKVILSTGKKIDVPKLQALLKAGWSYEKIAKTEFYCSIEELKEALNISAENNN